MTFPSSSSAIGPSGLPRRGFLRAAGLSAAALGLALAGCGDDDEPEPTTNIPGRLSFGPSTPNADLPILNYLLLLKQLEYAFYDKVVKAFPADLSAAEQTHLRDLRDHELVQQQVLTNAAGANALVVPPFEFTSLTLTTRAGVLAAAQLLEDTGAGAFLGIVNRLTNSALLALATRMGSVEARHSALVRDLRAPGTFSGDDQTDLVVTASGILTGQAIGLTPEQVKTVVAPFLPTLTISLDSLPRA